MSEIKVSLSLELRGGAMLSEQECSKNSKAKKKDCYDYFRVEVSDPKGRNKEILNVAVRKSKTVKQNIKLSKEAYDYMVNPDICPNPKLKKEWDKYSINQRLQYHCGQIAEALGAIGFTFEVLDD